MAEIQIKNLHKRFTDFTAVRDSWVPKIRDLSDGEQQLHGYLVATGEYEGRAS